MPKTGKICYETRFSQLQSRDFPNRLQKESISCGNKKFCLRRFKMSVPSPKGEMMKEMKDAKEIWANVAERNNEHRFRISNSNHFRCPCWREESKLPPPVNTSCLNSEWLERNLYLRSSFLFIETLVSARRKMLRYLTIKRILRCDYTLRLLLEIKILF